MTFMYVTTFQEQKRGSARCAAVAHLVPTWTPGRYRVDCYGGENQLSVAALRTFLRTLDLLPCKDDRITVISNCHEFAWDMRLVLSGRKSEFVPMKPWREFVEKIAANGMSMRQFEVRESSLMLSSEKELAKAQITQVDGGFVL